jgi:hypothetical protein
MQETNLGILLADFQNGVASASLKNYKTTLETGLKILELASYDLPILADIFENNQGFNDLSSKVESYLTTNVHFNYYRYTRHDEQLKETFDLDISKYDIRSLLILIRCNYIANGAYSIATRNLIESFEYIDQKKKTTSLEAIKKALPNVSTKYIENRYKDKTNLKRSNEQAKMILANLYLLSYNHKTFTYSESNGRVYNAFTSLNRLYRANELAFQLVELDIKSANPQIIDKIFKFDNWKNVYSSLMQAYEIDRNEAKILFNSTLNNHYLSVAKAKEVYVNSGYSPDEANQLAEATANQTKGNWFRLMANQEGQIMDAFISNNFRNDKVIRLHDACLHEPEFTTISNAVELGIIEFGKSIIEKENLHLNLKVDTYKTVLSTPPTEQFIVKAFYGKSKVRQVFRSESFSWYSDNFLQLSASFNISKPIISKEGKYRAPSEIEFLERIQKLYKISMYLNNGNDEHFKTCIEHLAQHIQFNRNYIYAVLPTWNFDINDALEYVKNRNWTYHGGISLTLSDFNSLYHKERRQYIDKVNRSQLKQDLIRLQDAVESNQLYFIDKKKYHSARHYEIGNLIDMVHNLIGIKRRNTINEFNKYTLKCQAIRESNIGRQISVSKPLKTPVNQRYKKKVDIFNKSKPTILLKLENAIHNIEELHNIDLLFTQPKNQEIMTPKEKKPEPINAHQAFSEPIDYTHSVYSNHTARTAILQGKDFYISYCIHVRISELMRNKLWENTNGFDSVKTLIQGQAIQLYNENYENVYAESMMST